MEIEKQIKKAQEGSQLAFTFLLNHFWNEVYAFMLKNTENETIAEDVTIETFSKAFNKIKSYNFSSQFNTWLIAIAKNVYIDLIRKNKNNFSVEINVEKNPKAYNIIDTSPSAEDKLITQQNLSQLLLYIKELKPHYQQVIQLRYFQEMSYQKIAFEIDESVNNIKIKLLRAKKLLAEIITKNQKK